MERDESSLIEYILTGVVVASIVYSIVLVDCAKTFIGNRNVRSRNNKNTTRRNGRSKYSHTRPKRRR